MSGRIIWKVVQVFLKLKWNRICKLLLVVQVFLKLKWNRIWKMFWLYIVWSVVYSCSLIAYVLHRFVFAENVSEI